MTRFRTLFVGLACLSLLAPGCSDSKDDGKASSTDAGTAAAGDAVAAAGDVTGTSSGGQDAGATGPATDAGGAAKPVSGTYPCNVPAKVSEPTRNKDCGAKQATDKKLGCTYPWGGIESDGVKLTCNLCKTGDTTAQGAWRFIDFKTEDPTTPLKYDLKQRLVVDGNTWHLRRTWTKDGVDGEIRIDGWYACSDKAEFKSQDLVWVVTALSPPDAFGYKVGHTYSGTWLTKGEDLMAWGNYEGMHKGKHFAEIYCRAGTQVNGKDCKDPFGS